MRRILLSLTVLAGLAAVPSGVEAAPGAALRPVLTDHAALQTVQYYRGDDWRHRRWREHQRWRHHEWRRHHHRRGW